MTKVAVTEEEAKVGIHFHLAEADLLEAGYTEPFIHFDEGDSPALVRWAVRQHRDNTREIQHPTEESVCPASSS